MTATTTSRFHRFLQYLEVEDGPQRQVDRAYRQLGSRMRREVVRMARQGRPHPDPYVSSVALAWARQMRSQIRRHLAVSAFGVVLFFGITLLVSSFWLHSPVLGSATFIAVLIPASVLGQSRLAKKVEAANQ